MVLSEETVALEVDRWLRDLASERPRPPAFLIRVHPSVAALLVGVQGEEGPIIEIEQETGKHFHFEGTEALPIDHFEVVLEGTREEVEERALPFREGEEVLVQIEEPHMYNDDDAVAKLDGYVVSVFGAASLVGERTLVRIEKVGRSAAQASLVDPPEGIVAAPVDGDESSHPTGAAAAAAGAAAAGGARRRRPRRSRRTGAGPMTLLADVVSASQDLSGTSSRSAKVGILAQLLVALDPSEVPAAVGFLSGAPRQGRVGVGYSTIYGIDRPPAGEPSLTIADLDRAIAEVQSTTGSGSAAKRTEILGELLARATAQEADFVRRLFTGDLRQGALAGLMVDAIAKAAGVSGRLARRALMLSGDLTRTAEIAIGEGEDGLRAVGFEIFRPVFPMLASTAASVGEAVGTFDRASVEWKLDGIRIQVHRRDDEIRIYTRNLRDITPMLPGIVAAVRLLAVTRAVFDGEALWMDIEGPAAFQDTVSQIDAGAPPEGIVTFLFDLLHVDGEDLLDTPLRERSARLEAIAPNLKIPSVITSDAETAQGVLDEALRAGHEGVVVKDAASLYTAGRRGKAWRKVKPVRTYDLVVLGAEWGHGRRQGWLSNLHLGARDPSSGEFVMVGKCFKGLTDELLEWQTNELLARETERTGIVVMVRPEVVVEIALDGVQSSTRYPGGVALRFARVKRYRPDKAAAEADTIEELRALLARP